MPTHPPLPFSKFLRRAFLAFVITGIVAILAFGITALQREQREVRDNLGVLSGFLASAIQSFFDDLGNGLEPLGQLLSQVDALDHPEHAMPYLMKFQARYPEIGSMAVITTDGRMIINTAALPGEKLPDFRHDPPYLKLLIDAMNDTAPYTVGRPEYGKILHQWRFPFRYTVRDDHGKPLFVIQAAIPIEKQGIFLREIPLPTQSLIGLLREDGYQQARWPVPNSSDVYGKYSTGPLAKMVRANPSLRSGSFTGYSPWLYTDKIRLGAYTHLSHVPMYAYVSVPMVYVWHRWWSHNGPILIIFLVFVVIFGWVAYRMTVHERLHSHELLNQARRDTLTGLPNRAGADELLNKAIELSRQANEAFAILYFDLDRFKDINDTLGHTVGDHLLVEVAKRVQKLLRQSDTLARLGGDEFLAILPGATPEASAATAERLTVALQEPFQLESNRLQISCSVGIAVFPDHGDNLQTLLKHADTAMYEAKRRGRSGFAFYEDELGEKIHRRLIIESRLRDALNNNEFYLHYQPIIELETGGIVSAEALIRWRDAEGNLHSAAEFVPIAEESGLILPLGEWVLKTACHQAKIWQDQGYDLRVSVNLSTRQFQDPGLLDRVKAVIDKSGFDPSRLELEVTESAAMLDPESSIRVLGALKDLGICIAIDDFGTGYSSLSYLRRIPAETIKIDKAFVDGVSTESEDAAIVRAILALARSLEKRVVAEGIETADQREALESLQCPFGQGYYFSRPISADAFEQLLYSASQNTNRRYTWG